MSRNHSVSHEADKYILRMPEGMRDSIRALAANNRRSMNAEIIYALDRVLAENEKGPAGAGTPPSRDTD